MTGTSPDHNRGGGKLSAWLLLILALGSGFIAAGLTLRYLDQQATPLYGEVEPADRGTALALRDLKAEVASLRAHLSEVERLTMAPTGTGAPPKSSDIVRLETNINRLGKDLQSIKSVIMDDATKAMETVLLRKEIENLKETNRNDLLAVRQELDRTYDLNKWFLGLIVTMTVTVIGLALNNLRKASSH